MKNKKLDELTDERNSLANDLREIDAEIEELREKEELPALRKKYEGKYFVYDNGFNATERWKTYIFCRQITGLTNCIIDCFESQSNGEHVFKSREESFISILGRPSSKKEYTKALRKFKNLVNSI